MEDNSKQAFSKREEDVAHLDVPHLSMPHPEVVKRRCGTSSLFCVKTEKAGIATGLFLFKF